MPVLERAADRHRVVADVVQAEWAPLDRFDWTPAIVAGVDADLAAGHEENHFHEAVPYVQFGLKALEQGHPDPSADDDLLLELARAFLPRGAGPAAPAAGTRGRPPRGGRGAENQLPGPAGRQRVGPP